MVGGAVLAGHQVRVEGERIVAIEPCDATPDHDLVTAGFVDLQVNGHDDVDVASATGPDWDRLAALLGAQGVTSWCPTLVSAPLPVLESRIAAIVEGSARGGDPRPEIVGVHLEGPFLGDAPGAHRDVPPGPVDADWLAGLPDLVRIVTLGPERPGATEAAARLSARGVVVSLGHTRASFDVARAAVDAGARFFTHVFNASGTLHQREPGALGVALADDRLTVGVIADGVHVHPDVLRLVWRAKPPGGVALVTDAVAWRAGRLAQAGVELRDGAPRLADGTLAGTALTMPAAVRYTIEQVGVPVVAALTAASATPARVLGMEDRGVVAVGRRADLVALTPDLAVEATWVGGERIGDGDAQPAGLG